MESIPIIQVLAIFLDPVVIGATVLITVALLTGVGARVVEFYESHRGDRPAATRTGGSRSVTGGRPVEEAA